VADALRGSMHAAEYKHVVLGVIFLKSLDMVNNVQVGDEAAWARDVLGRVYEYFLSRPCTTPETSGSE